jgi:hypothetical protein
MQSNAPSSREIPYDPAAASPYIPKFEEHVKIQVQCTNSISFVEGS